MKNYLVEQINKEENIKKVKASNPMLAVHNAFPKELSNEFLLEATLRNLRPSVWLFTAVTGIMSIQFKISELP